MSSVNDGLPKRKWPTFLVVITAIAGFIGYALPSPQGLELLFDYILGPTAFLAGYGIGRLAENKIKDLSIAGISIFGLLCVVLLVGAVVSYFWLYYNVGSLDFLTFIFEAGSFALIFLPMGLVVKLAGLKLINSKKKKDKNTTGDEKDESNDQNSDAVNETTDE